MMLALHRALGGLLLVALLFASSARADEASDLAAAKDLSAKLWSLKAKGSVEELEAALAEVPPLHARLKDKKRRRSLESRLGLLLRTEARQASVPAVLRALFALDDPQAIWLQLKRHMPDKKSGALSPLQRQIFITLRTHPLDPAIKTLETLATNGKSPEIRTTAVHALSGYGKAAGRDRVLSFLIAQLARHRPRGNENLVGPWVERQRERQSAGLDALCALTGQASRSPAAWIEDQKKHAGDPGALFDGSRTIPASAEKAKTAWRRAREALGKPTGAVASSIDRALAWLVAHQSPKGPWEAAKFDRWFEGKLQAPNKDSGYGNDRYDVGVTGLALTALLVAGFDGTGNHAYDKAVRRGLRWLRSIQDEEGCFGPRFRVDVAQIDSYYQGPRLRGQPSKPIVRETATRETYVYNHAAAAMAVVEAYGLTGAEEHKACAERAIAFIEFARNPYFAWRYGIKPGENDTSVSTWMVMPLLCARMIGAAELREFEPVSLEWPPAALEGVSAWLGKLTDPDFGQVGYTQRGLGSSRLKAVFRSHPPDNTEGMTAAGMTLRVLLGEGTRYRQLLDLSAKRCLEHPPSWDEHHARVDLVYWQFGSLALHALGHSKASAWQAQLVKELLANQRGDSTVAGVRGSWDPVGAWGSAGGRVYATALGALCLLSPYRLPVQAAPK